MTWQPPILQRVNRPDDDEEDDLDPGYVLPTEAPLWAKAVLIGAVLAAMVLIGWAIAQGVP